MAVKTVTLSEDAYTALASLKREGESFSDVVRRLTRGSRSLLEFAGDWKDYPAEKMAAYASFLEAGDRLSKTELRKQLGRRKRSERRASRRRSSSICSGRPRERNG